MTRQKYIDKIIKELNSINSEEILREIEKNVNYYSRIEQDTKTKIKNWYSKKI